MVGVCFVRENKGSLQDFWSFVFSNFGVSDIWEIGKGDKDLDIYQPTVGVKTAAELPDVPLVVFAHQEGRYIKGQQSLVSFAHPEDAIYMFGGSHSNLSEDDVGRDADYVYIPSVQHEMFSHCAAYIALYDRYVKRGGFG